MRWAPLRALALGRVCEGSGQAAIGESLYFVNSQGIGANSLELLRRALLRANAPPHRGHEPANAETNGASWSCIGLRR